MDEDHRLSDRQKAVIASTGSCTTSARKPTALTAAEIRQLTGQIAALPSPLPEGTQ